MQDPTGQVRRVEKPFLPQGEALTLEQLSSLVVLET